MKPPPSFEWHTPPSAVHLAGDDIHVWRIPLDAPPQHVQSLQSLLAPQEAARANRFFKPIDRSRYIIARGVLRTILGQYVEADPASIQIRTTIQGKPYLEHEADLSFNLSHADALALCAVTHRRAIGVDLERLQADYPYQQIADRSFSTREKEALAALPDAHRRQTFFTYWVRKEAILKASGDGLTIPLYQIEVIPAALKDSDWTVIDLAPHPAYVAALAVQCYDCHVVGWQWVRT